MSASSWCGGRGGREGRRGGRCGGGEWTRAPVGAVRVAVARGGGGSVGDPAGGGGGVGGGGEVAGGGRGAVAAGVPDEAGLAREGDPRLRPAGHDQPVRRVQHRRWIGDLQPAPTTPSDRVQEVP